MEENVGIYITNISYPKSSNENEQNFTPEKCDWQSTNSGGGGNVVKAQNVENVLGTKTVINNSYV